MLEVLSGDTYRATRMAMDAASLRFQVVSNNIANVDTPKYRNRVVLFEDQLKQVLFPDDSLEGLRTRPQHIPIGPEPLGEVPGTVTLSPAVAWRADGNTVDIDLETTRLIQTRGKYQAMARLAGEHHRSLRMAIGGGL
jgi:flagellar basal-body rod protein FlgB